MSNVVRFPRKPEAIQAEALEHLAGEMRIQFAIACTAAQGRPTASDMCEVLKCIANTLRLTDEYTAILEACK